MLKIGFSGIPDSGKTSLMLELKKTIGIKYNIDIVDDISNKSPFDENKETNFISQFYYFSTQINEENKKSINSPELLFCDKTIFDQWIYWKKYLSKVGENKQLTKKNDVIRSIYDYWINTYDFIFFIRVDPSVMENRKIIHSLRDELPNNDSNIESLYIKTIKKEKPNIIEIWNNKDINETIYKLAGKISEKLESINEN